MEIEAPLDEFLIVVICFSSDWLTTTYGDRDDDDDDNEKDAKR